MSEIEIAGHGPSAVSDERGLAVGDLLVFNGASFVRLPRGSTSQDMIVHTDGTIGWADQPGINLRGWFVTGTPTAGDAKKVQEAIESLPSEAETEGLESGSGGLIVCPQGTINSDTSIVLKNPYKRITFRGAGKGATMLKRTANVPILIIEGETDEASKVYENATFENFTLNTGTRGAWTEPLVRIRYAQFVHWRGVNFYRAGGSAISAVRYYDGEIQNCRFDYCSSTGSPVVHLMCSEQGKKEGEAGYSTDSCNNISFIDCTWEQNPGMDLHLDGRQSDGTYNASRRINLIRVIGGKMENQISTERSNEPRFKAENTSHLHISNLMISAKGVKEGAATDWLVLKKTYNTFIDRYTAVATEVGTTGMRTGLKLEETIGTKMGLVCGSVQTNNKPERALIEFAGENNGVQIDDAYYDNNPGNAPLYAGNPTSWANDPYGGRSTIEGWSERFALASTRSLTAKTTYYIRFVPTRPFRSKTAKFIVTTAATTNQVVQVAFCNSKLEVISESAETAGKLNGLGAKEVEVVEAVQFNPGVVYYLAISANTPPESGTGATLYGIANEGGNTVGHEIAGSAAPEVGWTSVPEQFPIPSKSGTPNAGLSSAPALWLVPA